MPNSLVKSYAKKSGKTIDHVERWWDEAKEEALKKFGKKSKEFYAYVNAIVKRRAGLSEELTFKEYILIEEVMKENSSKEGWFIIPIGRTTKINALAGPFKTKGEAISEKWRYAHHVEDDMRVDIKYGKCGSKISDYFEPLDEPGSN